MSLYRRLHAQRDSFPAGDAGDPTPPTPADALPPPPRVVDDAPNEAQATLGDRLASSALGRAGIYMGKLGVNGFMRSVGDFPRYKIHPIRTPLEKVVLDPAKTVVARPAAAVSDRVMPSRRRARNASEAAAQEAAHAHDRAASRDLQIEHILEYNLSYADVLYDEATVPRSPEAVAYARKLLELSEGHRGGELQAATDDIRQRFEVMCSLLPDTAGSMSRIAGSDSWIYWDVAKQEVRAIRPYRSPATKINYAGSTIDNRVFGLQGAEAAERTEFMRDVVAWRHLGWELHQQALNGEDVAWLDDILPPEGQTLLHSVGDEAHNGQLSSVLLAELGRYIDEALQSHAHVERRGGRLISI